MDSEDREQKTLYAIGLCGVGMSAVARLYQQAGWNVLGSDQGMYDPVKSYLEKLGMECKTPHDPQNIPNHVDVIMIGRHAKLTTETNAEVAKAYELFGDKVVSYPQVLQKILKEKNWVIAGSYGKSTCSSLLTHLLQSANLNPSYFIGALAHNFEYTSNLTDSDMFVLEGDEYPSKMDDMTSKFEYYNATSVLLTSAEHDHVNVFPTEEEFIAPFIRLVQNLPQNEVLVACIDGKNVEEVVQYSSSKKVITYSLENQKADYYAQNISYAETSSFTLVKNGEEIAKFKTNQLGAHSIQNMIGCLAFCLEHGITDIEKLQNGTKTYAGVLRRNTRLIPGASYIVYEGFGSSYPKARSAIDALQLHFPNKPIHVLFEPHTFSWRNKAYIDWYKTVFNNTQSVAILPPPNHGSDQHDQLTLDEIITSAQTTHSNIVKAENFEDVKNWLQQISKGDIVLLLSSGQYRGMKNGILDFLKG